MWKRGFFVIDSRLNFRFSMILGEIFTVVFFDFDKLNAYGDFVFRYLVVDADGEGFYLVEISYVRKSGCLVGFTSVV